MALNSNTAYLQYSADFSLLGKSMKRYAIASFISLAFGIIVYLIMQIVFLGPLLSNLDSSSFIDPYDLLLGMGGISIIISIGSIAIGIYTFVTYIQFLSRLKKVGEYTNDIELQKTYKMELWSWIVAIIMSLLLIIGLPIIIFGGGLLSFMMMDESSLYNLLIILIIAFLVIFVVAIISIVLKILSVMAFDRWGQKLKIANQQNPLAANIAEGANFMKWGRIISLFAGSLGNILFLVGFMKAGENIIKFFDGYGNFQTSQGTASPQLSSGGTLQQPGGFTTSPNLNSSNMGNTSYGNTTMKPQAQGFCSFCGSNLDDKNSMFCSNCGRKLF